MNLNAQYVMIALLLLIIIITAIDPAIALAQRTGRMSSGQMKQLIDQITQDLTPLTRKSLSRGFFSPEEAGKVVDIKLKMLDLMNQNPTDERLIRPAYESAKLFRAREMYDDAYDFFNFIRTNFPDSPYSIQSGVEIQRLKEQLGDTYFADSAAPAPAMAGAKPAASGK